MFNRFFGKKAEEEPKRDQAAEERREEAALSEIVDDAKPEDLLVKPSGAGDIIDVQ